MSRRATCRYHCSACREHFSSLNGFDAHRAGDHGDGSRYCLEPLDDRRFAAVDDDGICTVYGEPKVGITVWTLAEDLARARQRSGASPRSGAEGESDLAPLDEGIAA